MNAQAFRTLDPRPGERILEVGFGGGALLRRIRSSGADALGVDLSDAVVRRARSQGFQAFQGSVDALPLPALAVDKAVSVNSLYFWPDLPAAVAELVRVIRPGGTMVLCFQTAQSVRAWPGHRFGFHAYDEIEIRSALEGAGFRVVAASAGSAPKLGEFICLGALRGAP